MSNPNESVAREALRYENRQMEPARALEPERLHMTKPAEPETAMNERTEGKRDLSARKVEMARAIGKVNEVVFSAISNMSDEEAGKGVTPSEERPSLTSYEEQVARDLFVQVFPDLVRGVPHTSLKEATEKTVAALVAGLIALREASGNKP